MRIKPRSSSINENQAARKQARDLESMRQKILDDIKAKEDNPFGKADRHCIMAWQEIEQEDRQELLKEGNRPDVVNRIIMERREIWVEETMDAWKEYHDAYLMRVEEQKELQKQKLEEKRAKYENLLEKKQ